MDVNVIMTNRGVRCRPRARSSAISTSKPDMVSGWAGSASTNGAPPSASPAHLNSAGWPEAAEAHIHRAAANRTETILQRFVTGLVGGPCRVAGVEYPRGLSR